MADENYARLQCAGASFSALVARKTKPCRQCGASVESRRNRQYCDPCASVRKALKNCGGKCPHEKPRFSNGKERNFCYACRPKPEPKPRRPIVYTHATEARCEADGCRNTYTKRLPHERFCSDRCRERTSAKATQMRRRDNSPRPCRWCSKVYVPAYGSRRDAYCTEACAEFAKRKVRSGSTHRRRALKFGVEYQPINKRKVFERDGWRCYLCGRDTPRELSGTKHSQAPELEHVVPFAKGGAHTMTNVRCACRECNRSKGTLLPADAIDRSVMRAGAETASTADRAPIASPALI